MLPTFKPIRRIVLADDHCSVRDLFKLQLARLEPRMFEVVGEATNGHDAINVCLKTRPDIALLDLMMPGLNGMEVFRRLRPELPGLRVLFFSGATNEGLISEAFTHGAAGFVGKSRPWQTVLEALTLVAQGGRYFDPTVAHLTVAREDQFQCGGSEQLTAREREVAQLIAEGESTKEIAGHLGVSAKTIDKHRTHMMEKLGLHDAVGVTRFAIRSGMVTCE